MSDSSRTLQSVMAENYSSIEDFVESTPKAFAWDTSFYSKAPAQHDGPGMTPPAGEVTGSGGVGDETGGAVGGEIGPSPTGLESAAGRPFGDLDWSMWRFAMFAMLVDDSDPLLISQNVVVVEATERKIILDWYSSKRKSRRRSSYGKGAWSPDQDPTDRSKPDRVPECMVAACMTFPKLLCTKNIPKSVWDTVAEEVPLPQDDDEDE